MEGVTLNPFLGTKFSHLRYEICSLCLIIIEVIIYVDNILKYNYFFRASGKNACMEEIKQQTIKRQEIY